MERVRRREQVERQGIELRVTRGTNIGARDEKNECGEENESYDKEYELCATRGGGAK